MIPWRRQPSGVLQPDAKVRSIEDSTLKSSDGVSLQTLALESSIPSRPGFGTQGRPITLYANYLELVPPKSLLLYRYSI
jgi:eukaryotic translation initiation factor 2C